MWAGAHQTSASSFSNASLTPPLPRRTSPGGRGGALARRRFDGDGADEIAPTAEAAILGRGFEQQFLFGREPDVHLLATETGFGRDGYSLPGLDEIGDGRRQCLARILDARRGRRPVAKDMRH